MSRLSEFRELHRQGREQASPRVLGAMTDAELVKWGRAYLDSLPTSPYKHGDTVSSKFAGSCATGWRPTLQRITVHRGDVVDGQVIR